MTLLPRRFWLLEVSSQLFSADYRIIRNYKSVMYSLPLYVHTHQVYLLEQHSESFEIWSAIIKINTEGKSLIMKLGPDVYTY